MPKYPIKIEKLTKNIRKEKEKNAYRQNNMQSVTGLKPNRKKWLTSTKDNSKIQHKKNHLPQTRTSQNSNLRKKIEGKSKISLRLCLVELQILKRLLWKSCCEKAAVEKLEAEKLGYPQL